TITNKRYLMSSTERISVYRLEVNSVSSSDLHIGRRVGYSENCRNTICITTSADRWLNITLEIRPGHPETEPASPLHPGEVPFAMIPCRTCHTDSLSAHSL